ncbi:MAG TPA: efflux RND transporter periplasmic adaptor subunit [Candidatus Udaeobacter sp.]|nr:efflux RND transporter periplasmic adaptor subunit [Candidatus Udaeobacter sp.]
MKAHEHNGHGEHAVEDRLHGHSSEYRHGAARMPEHGIPTHPPVRSVAVWGPIAVVSVLALFVVIGAWRHMRSHDEQERFAQQINKLTVDVVNAQRDEKPKDLILPGTFQAFKETTIYARANGYVKDWKVDIGDNVKRGQLLAEIETPELDQQVAQAKASNDIAKITADRWRDLVAKNVVSRQEYDQNEKAYEGAKANYEQLQKLQGFKQIVAPFDGKISTRSVDFGTLVTAGSGNTGTPLFGIVQSDPLRVYVFAPQENAPSIHEGLSAKILVQEFPGQEFEGTVTRTAGALDPQSRTMQVEVQVPNHEGKLYAGMYGQVKFLLVDQNAAIVVPANAFLFRKEGAQVATIENEDRIHWQNIRVGRDFGDRIEVIDGLKEDTKVVMNPTDDLREGVQVEVKSTEESKPERTVAQSVSNRREQLRRND